MCIYIFSRHLFSYPFTHLHIRKTYCTHQSFFDCNIYITHDGWKEHLSAVFNNIVLVLSYRSFTLKEKKKKKDTRRYVFFVSFFLSVILKKTILIVLTVSFCHRLLCITHFAMLSLCSQSFVNAIKLVIDRDNQFRRVFFKRISFVGLKQFFIYFHIILILLVDVHILFVRRIFIRIERILKGVEKSKKIN